ncbi:MlaD family protein [Nocardioides sp. LHD-245]|uniref:MlaD family protein n=1 Tax=Nocardioides sp. LHD-245 TaxID=3051387 RepID=UPI0027DF91CF|nr:MlaD family protein [Nocardioides sp. LHD-245]
MSHPGNGGALKDVGRAGVVAALIAGGIVVVSSIVGDDDPADLLRARFVSAAPLVEGNEVKVDGVVVGTVESLEVVDGVAEVALDLDDEAGPLHQDARLTIRPVSLLGERYVDLDRGTTDAPPLVDGTVIPVEQTATSVGLDEVLNTVDDPTGAGLRALVTTLGEGIQGNGGNVGRTLAALAPSLKDTRALAAVLDQHNELLVRLIDQFEPVAGALATRDGEAMDQLVASSEQVLAAVRERQAKLERTLDRLPGTLAVLRSTLGNVRSAADDTAPTLAELRPLTDKLPQLSQELRAFSDVLDPALATSQPVLDEADALLRAAAPVAADLEAAAPGLARSTSGVEKVADRLTGNRDKLFDWIRFWALTTNGRDGLSHYFRVGAVVDPDMLTGLLPKAPSGPAGDPAAGSKQAGGKPGSGPQGGSGPAGVPNGVAGGVDGVLEGLTGLLTGLLQPGSDGSATGLTADQEKGLLGMLLGGLS